MGSVSCHNCEKELAAFSENGNGEWKVIRNEAAALIERQSGCASLACPSCNYSYTPVPKSMIDILKHPN